MKYIKKFSNSSEYNTFKNSADFVTPNVSKYPGNVKYTRKAIWID